MRIVLAAVLCGLMMASQSFSAERMNVLFISIDDLNDWVSPLGGHPQAKTPAMERLAARGITFTRGYCAAPACNPSRTAVMTGIRPTTSGVYTNDQAWRPVMPEVVTIPQCFTQHGYHSIGAGKIFHEYFEDLASWEDFLVRVKDPDPPAKFKGDAQHRAGGLTWWPSDENDRPVGDMATEEYVTRYLSEPHDKPFFLACGIYRPHLPWTVPQKYFDLYPLDSIELPEVPDNDLNDVPDAGRRMAKPNGDHANILQSGNWKRAVQAYLACISFADSRLDQVLTALDQSRYRDNTIIVLWSDHGWHLGEKRHWRKFALWEEATRVPLFFSVPGMTPAGARCDRTVDLMSLYPTLCELCGIPVGEQLEGKSIVPLLKNPQAEWNTPAVSTWMKGNHAVRNETYRYIRYADGSEELYDHSSDPHEWKNLATDPATAGIRQNLSQWLPKTEAPDAPITRNQKKYEQ